MVALRRITAPLAVAGVVLGIGGCGSGQSAADAGSSGTVWVANEGSNTISVLDAASADVRVTLTGIGAPHNVQAGTAEDTVWAVSGGGLQVAVADGGDEAFVTVGGSSELVRVDLSAGEVTGRVSMPASPAQVLLTEADELLVANQGTAVRPGNTVSVVDPDSLRVLASVPTGSGPHGLTASADGRRAPG